MAFRFATQPSSPELPAAEARFATSRQITWMKAGFVLLCVAFSITPLVNTQRTPANNKDYDIWFAAGRSIVQGEGLYPEDAKVEYEYMYPPTLAIFVFAPMSMLGYTAFVALFLATNAVVWYAVVQLSFSLFAGSRTRQTLLLFLLPFVVNVAFVYDTFLLGQVNVWLLLLMLGMFSLLRSGKPWLAGGCLALATAMKAFPLSAIAYLVWRRQWQAAAATLVWLVMILVVLPGPIRGFERNAHELALWYRGMLADQSGNSIGQRNIAGFTYKNQSLIAVTHRLTRHVPAGDNNGVDFYVNAVNMSPRESQLMGYGVILALGMIYIACMPAQRRQTIESLRCEEAMLLLMMIFCSPLAWTYFFSWTLPAWVVVVHMLANPAGNSSERRRGWWMLGIIGAVSATALTQEFDHTAQALGVTLWGSVGLFLVLGWMMRKRAAKSEIAIDGERTQVAKPIAA